MKAHDKEGKFRSYRNQTSGAPRHNPGQYASRRDHSRPHNRRAYEEEVKNSEEYRKLQERKKLEEKLEALPKLPELTDAQWFESSDEEVKLERENRKRKQREAQKKRDMKLMTKQ